MILDHLKQLGDSLRRDGWRNTLSGLGVLGRDRAVSTAFTRTDEIPDVELSDMYHFNDLAALIVDIFPGDALRRGVCVNLNPEAQERWKSRLLVKGTVREGSRWGRLFGLAVVVIGADDGQPVTEPLNMSAPRPIAWLEVFDRRQVQAVRPLSGLYSRSDLFTITRANGAQFDIHRSRCLVFGGATTAQQERERRMGADFSVLQRPYEIMRDFANGYLALGSMLTDASQGVFSMKGLVAGLVGGKRQELINRLELMDASRSIARAIILDSDGNESFTKVATSFAGVPDSIDRLTGRLSLATGIPVEMLGQALAGLNATGESSTRTWYDRVEAWREDEIDPRVEYLARVELGPAAAVVVSYPPLWQPTAKEQAEVAKIKIDGAVALADREAITSEELSQLASGVGVKIDPNVPRTAAAPAPEEAPAPVTIGDDEEAPPKPAYGAELAAQMTEHGATRCEHGKPNRCRLCGVEKERGVTGLDENGGVIGQMAWRAIDHADAVDPPERVVRVKAPNSSADVIVLRLRKKSDE